MTAAKTCRALVVIGPGYYTGSLWGAGLCERLGTYSKEPQSDGSNYYHYAVDSQANYPTEWGGVLDGSMSAKDFAALPQRFGVLLVMPGSFAVEEQYASDPTVQALFQLFRDAGKVIAAFGNGICLPIAAGVFDGLGTEGQSIEVNGCDIPETYLPPTTLTAEGIILAEEDIPCSADGPAPFGYRVVTASNSNTSVEDLDAFTTAITSHGGVQGGNPFAGRPPRADPRPAPGHPGKQRPGGSERAADGS